MTCEIDGCEAPGFTEVSKKEDGTMELCEGHYGELIEVRTNLYRQGI